MKVFLLNIPWIEDSNKYGVKAGARWASVRYKDRTIQYFPFPFSLAYTTTYLKQNGIEARLIDGIAQEITRKKMYDMVKEGKPDLIIIDTSTPSIYSDLEFAGIAHRQLKIPVALCGPHASALPEECIKKDGAHFVLLGEMELTALELANAIESGKLDYDRVEGLAFFNGYDIQINNKRPLLKDLDILPYPERHDIPIEKYTDPTCKKFPNICVISSRGCPYHCIYCLETSVFYGKTNYRMRNPVKVVDEIEYIVKEFKVEEVYFDDSSFTTNIKHARSISSEILDRGLKIYWSCMADARTDEETLLLMKKSGCRGLKFGVESADENILKNIKKPLDLETVIKFTETCRKLGLYTHATYMFGLPGENKETIKKTIDFAFKLRTSTAQFSLATPYPGTEFYSFLVENNYLKTRDFRQFEGGNSSVISYPSISYKEIEEAVRYTKKRKMIALLKDPIQLSKYIVKLSRMEGWNIVFDLLKKGKFVISGKQ
ncbi:MAG: radical SAM protein [Candidatus Coatesbacteria bacterium]|nr:radical SAM protein [Candidatus Coatesbacteria bacterium]